MKIYKIYKLIKQFLMILNHKIKMFLVFLMKINKNKVLRNSKLL